MTRKLLIVDDDPEITSGLGRGLALHGYDTAAANRADLAMEYLQSGGFDGAIVDVMLGADSGLDLVKQAREGGAHLPILMLSALSEVEDRMRGLEVGADDYIVKPFSLEELVARLEVQMRRVTTLRPVPAEVDPVARTIAHGDQFTTLTEREMELLQILIAAKGNVRSRGEIFDSLWAAEGSKAENVVDVYVGYIRKKLSEGDFGFEIKTVRHKGFCIEGMVPTLLEQS